jgi:very-short-patch-repair endonuclease
MPYDVMMRYWRKLYSQQTEAEQAIEPAIAALGKPYRAQHPFWGHKYFADFAIFGDKIIIEVDGDSHNRPEQKEKDLLHEAAVLKQGWVVTRVSNEMALSDPKEAVQYALDLAKLIRQEFPDKESQAQRVQDQLRQLHRDYPDLAAAAANRAMLRRQSALAAASLRRERKREALLRGLQSPPQSQAAKRKRSAKPELATQAGKQAKPKP